MSTQRTESSWTFNRGYHPDQPRTRGGVPGTAIAGENVVFEDQGFSRVFGGWGVIAEDFLPETMPYTGTLSGLDSTLTITSGDIRNDFTLRQHVLVGKQIFLITEFIDATHARVSPKPGDIPPTPGYVVKRIPTLHALDSKRAALYAGNPTKVRGEAIFAVGRGPLKVAGAAISAALNAQPTPYVAYPTGSGSYDVRPVGFTKPTLLPTLTPVAGGTKEMPAQRYSIKLTKKRLGFQGYGLAGEAVSAELAAGQRFQLTLPAFDASEGQTAWLVWASKAEDGESEKGPWWLLDEYTDLTPITVEWRSEELTDELVDNNDPPPPCLYCLTFNDLVLMCSFGDSVDGTSYRAGGPGVAVSKPFNVEGFPEEARAWVTPAEEITLARAGSVYCFFGSANSISYGQLAGSDINPLVIRPFWHSGCAHNYCGVMAGDIFYALTGSQLIRTVTGADVDFQFSARVRSKLEEIQNPRAFLGYDPRGGKIVIFSANHRVVGAGAHQTMALSYNLRTDTWDTPCYLGDGVDDFTVCGTATVGEQLCLVTADGNVWTWDDGDASQSLEGFACTAFQDWGMPQYLKTARRFNLSGSLSGSVKLYRDYDYNGLTNGTGTVPEITLANPTSLPRHIPTQRPNWHGRSFAVRLEFDMPVSTRIVDDFDLGVEGKDGAVY